MTKIKKMITGFRDFFVSHRRIFLCLFLLSLVAILLTAHDLASLALLFSWIMVVWLYQLSSNCSFWWALINLCFCPLLLLFQSEYLANNFAVACYLFLCVGAVQALLELKTPTKKRKDFASFLFDFQKACLIKKPVDINLIIRDFQRTPLRARGHFIWTQIKKYSIVILILLTFFALLLFVSQIFIHLQFVWWLFGRAYISKYFPSTFMIYDLIFAGIVIGLLLLATIFLRRKKTCLFSSFLILLIVATVILSHKNNYWRQELAQTPLIFTIHDVGGENDPQLALRGAIFGEIQGQNSQVLFAGQELNIRNWSNNTVVVDRPESGAEDLYKLENWLLIDNSQTQSRIWDEVSADYF